MNKKITEMNSEYDNLELMGIRTILNNINKEDQSVPLAVQKSILSIESLVKKVAVQMKNGGRLFYIGAGTSGRLGIIDASECPPTFGVSDTLVIGLIAGGDKAIRKAVEHAEDSLHQGWQDLKKYNINTKDFVIGIAASGSTPYVLSALKKCKEKSILTGCIVCNPNSPLSLTVDYPIEVIVGPEFLTGSSRMKAGTAQKLVLNMISTATMIQLGRVQGNKMVDMKLSNNKLINRAQKMVVDALNIDIATAKKLLDTHKNVRDAINAYKK